MQKGVAAVRRRQDWVARAQRVDDLVPQDDLEVAPSHYQAIKTMVMTSKTNNLKEGILEYSVWKLVQRVRKPGVAKFHK